MRRKIPDDVALFMRGRSMRSECPVRIDELELVEVRHVGFDGATRAGRLVVHADVARDVLAIFDELLHARFPIERVELVDAYDGDDARSMDANNTSAFNGRRVAAAPDVWSKHAFGRAIDVNPIQNPYARPHPARVDAGGAFDAHGARVHVEPAAGLAFLDRSTARAGMIVPGDACHTAFTRRGWVWGGSWLGRVDYQHFEKP